MLHELPEDLQDHVSYVSVECFVSKHIGLISTGMTGHYGRALRYSDKQTLKTAA